MGEIQHRVREASSEKDLNLIVQLFFVRVSLQQECPRHPVPLSCD
jgi:hypothetical protein